jgi:ribosome-associated protein
MTPDRESPLLRINHDIVIADGEIRIDYVLSSGPGGQNVNKVATAAQLRFDVASSPSLPDEVRGRLIALAGRRVSGAGVLIIHAGRHRSQGQNRADAVERLVDLIRRAAVRPKRRRKTRPTAASRRRRLESKRQRGETKRLRRGPSSEG